MFDLDTGGTLKHTIQAHREGITTIVFTPDREFVVSASAYTEAMPKVWSLATGTLETKLEGHSAWIANLAFVPDGKQLVSAAADQTIRLWNVETWSELAVLRGHHDEVSAIALAPNGRWIASGSRDGSVLLWDVRQVGQAVARRDFERTLAPLGLARDGKTVFSFNSDDRKVAAWNILTGEQRDLLTLSTNSHIDYADRGIIAVHEELKTLRIWEQAFEGADVLISLSASGPGVIKPEWIKAMAPKSIVFVCANPVPEIYPYEAKAAGAFIVGTGRGDFPNQVNNSLGFPGILKGALMVRARKITDQMAIAAARSLATYTEKNGIHPEYILARMNEAEVFPYEAADVAMQAIKDGVARIQMSWEEAYEIAKCSIENARQITHALMEQGWIKKIPDAMIQEAFEFACNSK